MNKCYQVAQNVKKSQKQQDKRQTHSYPQAKNEKKNPKSNQKKLANNKSTVSNADKGNSIVIMYQDYYGQKVLDFVSQNNFLITNSNITKKFQKENRGTINGCQQITPNDSK